MDDDFDLEGMPTDFGLFPVFFWLVICPFGVVGLDHLFRFW